MMIAPQHFCAYLAEQDIGFFCGVPDSLLKHLCAYVDGELSASNHVITANEGNAIALATGHYLGSGNPAVVYMQNSGLGNAINPLVSLADKDVYSIPMLLVIGWRGEPGDEDEPQHVKQGRVTQGQLALLDIPFAVLDSTVDIESTLAPLLQKMHSQSIPVAVLVKKNTFSSYKAKEKTTERYSLIREQVLAQLLNNLPPESLIVSTTGKTSREVFELRTVKGQQTNDFLTVGAMGHTASIAMGVAMTNPTRRVVVLDGDGSMLMHMGALPVIGARDMANFVHVVLNNQCHESVGGQPTVAGDIDLRKIALGAGYRHYFCATDVTQLDDIVMQLKTVEGPVFFEVKIMPGSRSDLGRPSKTPEENKILFMQHAQRPHVR